MVEHVLSTLNHFHSSIKFTYDPESGNNLSFLGVQLIRTGENTDTCVFKNELTQISAFTGTHLHHFRRNSVHLKL